MANQERLDGVPTRATKAPVERRNQRTRKVLEGRVRCEFEEMPGASLTIAQASRLFNVRPDVSARIFGRLIDEGLLRLTPDGRYRRPSTAA